MADNKRGQVKVYPGVERFAEQGVIFTNGARNEFDAVVLATGYRPALGFLRIPEAEAWQRDRLTIPTKGQEGAPGLYFSGFASPVGGTLHEIAIEAQNIARNIAMQRQPNAVAV